MKNKITDLRNHLFEQLERLNQDDITDEALEKEVFRAEAMTKISDTIIKSAAVEVAFIKASGIKGTSNHFILPEENHDALTEGKKKKGNDVGLTALKS